MATTAGTPPRGTFTAHGEVLRQFPDELKACPFDAVACTDTLGVVAVGGKTLSFVEDESHPWRWD